MSSILLSRAPRALTLGLGLGTTTLLTSSLLSQTHPFTSRPLLCDSSLSASASSIFRTYQNDAKTPVVTKDNKVNPAIFRQVSSGSILGLVGGLAVSMFSRTLTFLIGAAVAGVQYLEFKGIHVVPTQRIQGWVKGVNVRGLVRDNVAFKVCFGVTFALAAFAEF